MSNITKNHKVGIFAVFIASALMLGTISVSGLDSVFATGKSYDKGSDNEIEQEIEMNQAIKQDSQCVSGETTELSCNNIAVNLQNNTGNQAAGIEE